MLRRAWFLDESPTSGFQAGAGRAYRMAGAFLRNPLAVLGALIVLGLIVTAIFAPLIAPQSPVGQNLDARLLPPSAAHWMGTDELGRDIFSRVVYGSRITLMIVILVAVISAPLGLLIGAVSRAAIKPAPRTAKTMRGATKRAWSAANCRAWGTAPPPRRQAMVPSTRTAP